MRPNRLTHFLAWRVLLPGLAWSAGAFGAPAVSASISLPDPVRWDYVSVDPGAHRLYVAHRERVDVIDTATRTAVLRLEPTPGVHGAAAAAELNRVFTSNGADGTVGVFDATTGKLLRTVGAGKDPDAIVYEPATRRVFAFNGESGDVTAIDARSLEVLATLRAAGTPEFAVVDGRGRVFFNVEDTGELAVIDATRLVIERHYSLAPCRSPSGLTIDPKGLLYSVCRNGVMVVSDPVQARVVGQAPIGRGPDGVAWLDGKAWSANGQDGTLSVVAQSPDGRFATVATIPTARGARTIAADPAAHALFSPTADFQSAAAPASAPPSRPHALAGTFRVLVIEGTQEP